MYLLQRWNYTTREYEPFISNAEKLILYTQDMDLEINCPNCCKPLIYGDSYTSKEIHNNSGLGFPVCPTCHIFEMIRDRKYDRV